MSPAPSFGVAFPAHADVRRLPSFAAEVEQAGFDELWVVEDCFLSGGLVMAATALAITRTLRVGVGLLPAPVRNPAIAAMEIAALARLHPDRLTIAYGHGVRAWMDQIGALPAKRLTALAEVVETVRRLLAGETVTVEGSHVRLASVALDNPPERPPTIVVGTTGPKGLGIAGEHADGVLIPEGCGLRFVEWAREQVRAARDRSGEPRTFVYVWAQLEDDDERARELLRPGVDKWLGSGLYPEPVRAAALPEPLAPGPVPREVSDRLAIAGDPDACRAALQRFAATGADSIILFPIGDDYEEQARRFAAEVLPAVKRQ